MEQRLFVTGDQHGHVDYYDVGSKKFPEGKELTKNDVVVCAGDYGLLWCAVPDNLEIKFTKWYDKKKFTTTFVDGNHENFDRINKLPQIEKFNSTVGKVSDSIFHLKRGEVYTIGDKKIFTFGGGVSIDRAMRVVGKSWWHQEMPTYAEMDYGIEQLEKHNYKVDYIITHTCPIEVFGRLHEKFKCLFIKAQSELGLRKYFSHIAQKVEFEKWCFGHFHFDYDMGKYRALYHDVVELT